MDEAEKLKRQNNGQSWRNCHEAGMPHRWVRSTAVGDLTYLRCTRCPVGVTRKEEPYVTHPCSTCGEDHTKEVKR